MGGFVQMEVVEWMEGELILKLLVCKLYSFFSFSPHKYETTETQKSEQEQWIRHQLTRRVYIFGW